MTELYKKSLEELHSLLVSKEITATDLTSETFARIKETEPKVDAFLALNEEKAQELAQAIDQKGITESNVLAGIPIGIWMNLPWAQVPKRRSLRKRKTLGTKQKYLVVHQVARQLPLQLDKFPYH